ncbi:DUF3168 domain-containing protein [Pseudophaeobacter flagellatus]|uniref:DUF3168 domain-containing protein n=1 Tax=Pseudophaeobacter flagellatus TaxID=2899119 RepID=UPI001E344388|nr:DUF3168 domain-containing protein [Pseudophaeobacter flagellatus]MCD9147690.1 DUF3168 domain-containing protein [Pseudophaeobacter flagellatus]
MTYALASGLQQAVFQHLSADPAVSAALGSDLFDALPSGTLPQLYAVLGSEEVVDRSDASAAGARHRFTISVFTSSAGFSLAKEAAGAICDALIDAALVLPRGHLVGLWFERATAQRLEAGGRSITLMFAARVDDS